MDPGSVRPRGPALREGGAPKPPQWDIKPPSSGAPVVAASNPNDPGYSGQLRPSVFDKAPPHPARGASAATYGFRPPAPEPPGPLPPTYKTTDALEDYGPTIGKPNDGGELLPTKKVQPEDNKKQKRPKGKGNALNSGMLLGVIATLGVLVLAVMSLSAAGVYVFHHQPTHEEVIQQLMHSLQDPRMADLLRNVTEEIVQVQLSTSQLEGKVEAGLISPEEAEKEATVNLQKVEQLATSITTEAAQVEQDAAVVTEEAQKEAMEAAQKGDEGMLEKAEAMQEVAKEALAQAEEEVTEMAHAVNAEHQVAEAGAEFPGNNAALEKQAQTGLNNLTDAVHDAAEALSEKVDVEVQVTDAITDVASQMVEAKEEGQLASNQTAADDDGQSAASSAFLEELQNLREEAFEARQRQQAAKATFKAAEKKAEAKVLKKSTPKELARELQRKEKEKEKAQEAKEKAQEAKEKEKDKKADKKGEHWHHHASNAEKDDGFLFQEHFELPEEEPPEPPRKRPTSLKERMAANIRKSSGRRLLGARKARMQRALGAAALEVKPLSASADFHDELTSVRAAAGKLLDSEEGQATSTAVQMNQALQPQPTSIGAAAPVGGVPGAQPSPSSPAPLAAPPGMAPKKARVWMKKHRTMQLKQQKKQQLEDRRLAVERSELDKLAAPDTFGEAWHARMTQGAQPLQAPAVPAEVAQAEALATVPAAEPAAEPAAVHKRSPSKAIVHAEKRAMKKAHATSSKKDFWGFITSAMTSKSPQEQAAADTAEKEAQGVEAMDDPVVYDEQSTEATEEPAVQQSAESMGGSRRRLRGVGPQRDRTHVGQDLEEPGALEATLAKRSQGKEVIFLAVGDTRDHRRAGKDPALKDIAVEFVGNCVANLHMLGLDNYVVLASSPQLCLKLHAEHAVRSCVWSSLYSTHPGLPAWHVNPGDMFHLWLQQWHYILHAVELGYNVLRSDSDVYFTESPYGVLRGPLLSKFNVVSQTDVFADRIDCLRARPSPATDPDRELLPPDVAALDLCGRAGGPPVNIGLIYFNNAQEGGGVLGVLRTLVKQQKTLLDQTPKLDGAGNVVTDALIDQPIFREALNRHKSRGDWWVMRVNARQMYEAETSPHHRADYEGGVQEARGESAMAFTMLESAQGVVETFAGAPDWLFGRGCLKEVKDVLPVLQKMGPLTDVDAATREMLGPRCGSVPGFSEDRPPQPLTMPAPGRLGHALVGVHFVYSKASKRKMAMQAMGWWHVKRRLSPKQKAAAEDAAQGGLDQPDDDVTHHSCLAGSGAVHSSEHNGILFSHTFFRQVDEVEPRAWLCAAKSGADGCPCCVGLPGSPHELAKHADAFHVLKVLPDDRQEPIQDQAERILHALPGCGMEFDGGWNEFWD